MGRRRRGGKRVHLSCDPITFDEFYQSPLLGIDEVGTGCIAGPVCAAGVVLPRDRSIAEALASAGLQDSKKMTELARERVFALLEEHAYHSLAVYASPKDIDRRGLGPSLDDMFTQIIMRFRELRSPPSAVLIDGNSRKGVGYMHQGVRQGDQRSLTISAASVWAKVSRDRLMKGMAEKFPGYGMEQHKGYDTKQHREALIKLGSCSMHRMSTKTLARLKDGQFRQEE